MDFLPAQARAGPVSSIDQSKAKLLGGGHLAKTTIVSCKDQGRKEWRKVSSPLPHVKKARMKGGSEETGEERSQKPQSKIGFLTRPAIPMLKNLVLSAKQESFGF
jgi:hypothetical protein